MLDFSILNWNIGGGKFLEERKEQRERTHKQINVELKSLIARNRKPNVVTLQEIVRYGESSETAENIIDPIEGYNYYPVDLIDSDRLSSKSKWKKITKNDNWPPGHFFAQGNAMLIREDMPHFPVWDLSKSSTGRPKRDGHIIERVNFESGLYFGDRNTEPRAALVAHFIFDPRGENREPLDVFVVNTHLTTLMMEREGIPEIDLEASSIRERQIDIIFRGIVSRYNTWKRLKFPERGLPREPEDWETFERYEPVWILAGDFNFTPDSMEYEKIKRMNFIEVVPDKGSGTKAKGAGKEATLTLDYIFAGPKFISLDPIITQDGIRNNNVDHTVTGSDHYPLIARIPIRIP